MKFDSYDVLRIEELLNDYISILNHRFENAGTVNEQYDIENDIELLEKLIASFDVE